MTHPRSTRRIRCAPSCWPTAAMLLLGGSADAHEFKAGPITVEHPWARPAAKGNGAAYFALDNTGQAGTG